MYKSAETTQAASRATRKLPGRLGVAAGTSALALSLLSCGGENRSGQSTDDGAPVPSPSITTSATPQKKTKTANRGPWQEVQQFGAFSFEQPVPLAGKGPFILKGTTVAVLCRIAGTEEMGETYRKGGLYKIADLEQIGGKADTPYYAAANTFENGEMPNDNPFDPDVRKCRTDELPAGTIEPSTFMLGVGDRALVHTAVLDSRP